MAQREEDEEQEAQQAGAEGVPVATEGVEGGRGEPVRKEMYLVKWKNLSYLHNSWEMSTHLQVTNAHVIHQSGRKCKGLMGVRSCR